MKKLGVGSLELGVVLLVAAATSAAIPNGAFAEVPTDTQLTLGEVGLPVYIHQSLSGAGFTQPPVAYPISTVRAPTSPEEKVTAVSTKDATMTWELAAWTVGRTLSEQPPDARLGDFCKDIPYASDEIDWAATIASNATAVAEGRIVFDTGAANPYERVVFTASGATEVTWVRTGGGTTSQTYSIGSPSGVQLCDPMDCSLPGFSVHGIFRARILEWVSIFFSKYHYCRENLLTFAELPD